MGQVIYKNRKKTNSMKWDSCKKMFGKEDLLALWVADMDFEVPACVKKALKEYVDFGVFGYYTQPEGYAQAFIRWEEQYHGYKVQEEWIRFSPGVVPAIHWLVQLLTQEGDGVLIQPPVYYPFRDAILHNARKLVESPLVRGKQGYTVDYRDFERKIIENDVKLFIFCSPHNPVGRVWKMEEIQGVMDICKRHHVYVISDEIHQDIIMPGSTHTAAALAGDYDEILITLTAATKTFNLAACQNSILVIPDDGLRGRFDRYQSGIHVKSGNAFGYIAAQSAYEQGRGWLEEALKIIEGNYRYMRNSLTEALPMVWIPELEGTYLMWVDLGSYVRPGEMEQVMRDRIGLAVDYGRWFGGKSESFIRVNLATSRGNIELASRKLIEGLGRAGKREEV